MTWQQFLTEKVLKSAIMMGELHLTVDLNAVSAEIRLLQTAPSTTATT